MILCYKVVVSTHYDDIQLLNQEKDQVVLCLVSLNKYIINLRFDLMKVFPIFANQKLLKATYVYVVRIGYRAPQRAESKDRICQRRRRSHGVTGRRSGRANTQASKSTLLNDSSDVPVSLALNHMYANVQNCVCTS